MDADGVVVEVNGSAVQPEVVGEDFVVELSGEHNEVEVSYPIVHDRTS